MANLETLRIGNGGWCRVELTDFPTLYVRIGEGGDGQLEPVEMYMRGELDTDMLRAVPLGQITAAVNGRDEAAAIRARLRLPGPDLGRLASYFSTTFGTAKHWVADSMMAQIPKSGIPQPPFG